jgi:GT2 family glycosyltransferase
VQEEKQPQKEPKLISPDITDLTKGVYGKIELVNKEGIFGWVADLDSSELPILELHMNDQKIAETSPSIKREDIANLFKKEIISGFEFRWAELEIPEELITKKVKIKVIHQRTGLPLAPGEIEFDLSLMEESEKIQEPEYIGNLDFVKGFYVYGWAYNKKDLDERVEVVVFVDDKPVAEGVADLFRQDLLDAGIGDGKHGFIIKLPEDLVSNEERVLSVKFKKMAKDINHSPQKVKFQKYEGEVKGLNHNAVEGYCLDLNNLDKSVHIFLIENKKILASAWTNPSENGKFILYLPEEVLDGRPHIFEIRTEDGFLIGYAIGITPYFLTPYDALEKYSKYSPHHLSPNARFRYEALIKKIENVIHDPQLSINEKEQYIQNLYKLYNILQKGYQNIKTFDTLVFPKFKNPKVSIIIPVYNKFELTYTCLASILLTVDMPYEVIVVDDASTDKTTEIEEIVKNIKVVRNEKNEMFVRSCNKGAKFAEGEYIVLLNNDTEVLDGWLREMLWVFENFEKVGMVGAKLLYPDLTLQEAGGIVWGNGKVWNYGRNQNAFHPKFNYTREVDYCSGACIMLPKKLWDELGGFDEEFAPAYWEETDLAFRVREKGYKVVYTPFAQVIHYEGMSAGKDPKKGGMKKYQEINETKFKKRWGHILLGRKHEVPSFELADIVKDRNRFGRVLCIDYEIPRPDKEAGGYATFQEIKLFQALGFKVTFVPQNLAYLYGYVEDLQRMGVEVLYAPYLTSVGELIEKRGKEFDIFYIVRWYVAKDYVDLIRRVNPDAKIIFNNADLHFLRELREAIATQNRELLAKAIETRDKELEVMRKVDLTVSYNEVEHAVILSHNLDSTKVAKWPWVVYPKDNIPGFDEREHIAFLGNYRHTPNVVAVKWFVKNVMPLLKEELPEVKFLIYGANVNDEVEELESENVEVKGYVENLDEVFKTCRIFVAPLQSGAGIKGKVIECLSYGVPSILSSIAVEGSGIRDGFEALIAEKPEDWVLAIKRLYTDAELWNKISKNALEFVKKEYSFEKGLKTVRRALELIDIYVPENVDALFTRWWNG